MEKLPPQIERPLADYLHESNARMVYVVPLFAPEPLIPVKEEKEKRLSKSEVKKKSFGALVIEQMSESRAKPGLTERTTLVADHTSAALHNAVTHQSLFLLPLWQMIGRNVERLRGRTLVKVIAGAVALAVITVALVLVPWEYRVEAKGRLMPSIQHDVFAAWDGEVIGLFVTSGKKVQKGDPLVQLRNEELQLKLLNAENELIQKNAELQSFEAQKKAQRNVIDRDRETELDGKIGQTRIEIAGAKLQVEELKQQTERLLIRAPIDGTIATFQIEQFLRNRPVARGEKLMEVLDETGAWRLELELPENRLGHVLRRAEEIGDMKLPVEFLPATSTEQTFNARLVRMATKSAVTEGEGTVLEVIANIDDEELPKLRERENLRIGAEVKAKIGCGDSCLGYVLFGDVIEFVQKYVLLW